MNNQDEKKCRYIGLLRCIIIGLITAGCTFGYFLINNKGALTICADFDEQQLTFAQAVWNMTRYANGGQWCWNLDLGTSVIGGFGFYNLGSPFYWIFLVFPKGSFPYLAGFLYILKYTVACAAAYTYLSLFRSVPYRKNTDYALIGALLYAFSGFQTVNLEFFHFHDVVAFFPLLLWGIETIDDKSKRPFFVLSIFLNCLVNYFFFIQEVIFMCIYFIFRFWGVQVRLFLWKMLICILCGILGVGMAGVLFLPSILYIMGNTRSDMALYLSKLAYDSRELLYLLKGILLPGDAMRENSAIMKTNWLSTSCYLPLFGMSCVIAFLRKSRNWLQKLIVLLLCISFFPVMHSGFLLFTAVYQRWWYMLILVMALATMIVLEKPDEYEMSFGIWVYLIITTVYYLCVTNIAWNSNKDPIVFFPDRFGYFFIIAVSGILFIDLLRRLRRSSFYMFLICAMICCAVTTGLTLSYYRDDANTKKYMKKYKSAMNLKVIDDQYRYNSTENVYTLTSEAAGIGAFSSTIENSSHEFDKLLDVYALNSSRERAKIPGIAQLLGGKYEITTDKNAGNIVDKITGKGKKLYVTEGDAFPIGFVQDKYLFANELVALPQEQRGIALAHAAVILSSDENKIRSCMDHIDVEAIDYEKDIVDLIRKAEKNSVSDFQRDAHGFQCTSDFDLDKILYFSVPNDAGWTAKIDGQVTDIIDSGGMMLLKVPAGAHSIEFSFQTPGLTAGIIISVLSWVLFAIFLLVTVKPALRCRRS